MDSCHIDLSALSIDALEWVLEDASTTISDEEKLEQEQQTKAIADFEVTLSKMLELGAANRQIAIRWIREADSDILCDTDHFEFSNGLPYGYLSKAA